MTFVSASVCARVGRALTRSVVHASQLEKVCRPVHCSFERCTPPCELQFGRPVESSAWSRVERLPTKEPAADPQVEHLLSKILLVDPEEDGAELYHSLQKMSLSHEL